MRSKNQNKCIILVQIEEQYKWLNQHFDAKKHQLLKPIQNQCTPLREFVLICDPFGLASPLIMSSSSCSFSFLWMYYWFALGPFYIFNGNKNNCKNKTNKVGPTIMDEKEYDLKRMRRANNRHEGRKKMKDDENDEQKKKWKWATVNYCECNGI